MPLPSDERPSPLQHALTLAAEGFYVFPCIENGRLPAIRNWPQRATRDPDTIRKIWTSYDPVLEVLRERDFNVGIFTGKFGTDQHLVVLDVDMKNGKDGEESLSSLDMLDGTPNWLETRQHRTPSGGRHFLYVSDTGAASTTSRLGKGLDTRGEGGFIVAPGSTIDGKSYTVEDPAPLRTAPSWFVEKIGRPIDRGAATSVVELLDTAPAMDRARDFLKTAEPAVEGAGGDAHTFEVACRVGDFGVSQLTCLDLMTEHWNDRCSPAWTYEALAQKVENAYAYRKRPLGEKDATADFEPITDDDEETEAEAKEPLVFARPSDFADRDPPPREWFLDGLIPKGKVTLLSGDGGVGKTLVALQTMTAAAAGQPQWFGRNIQSCKVLGVFSEDDTDELWRRQADICRETDAQMRDLERLLWWSADHVASTGCVLMTFNNQYPAGKHTAFFKKLERAIAEQRPGLVVLDPAANMFGGNEIDRSQVTGFINRALNYLCVTYGVTILLLTHPSVAGMSEGTGRSGSTGWSNAVRSRLYLTRTEGDTTGDYRTLKTTKANYGKFGEEIVLQWRRGTFQAVVGTDSDPELAANRALILAFKILAERGDTSSHSSRASNYLVAQAMKMPEVKGFGRTALEAALERLLRAGTFKVEQIKGADRHPRPQLALVEGDEFDRPENVNFD